MIAYFHIVPVRTIIYTLNRQILIKKLAQLRKGYFGAKKAFCICHKLTKESVASHYYYLFSVCF